MKTLITADYDPETEQWEVYARESTDHDWTRVGPGGLDDLLSIARDIVTGG